MVAKNKIVILFPLKSKNGLGIWFQFKQFESRRNNCEEKNGQKRKIGIGQLEA
jgi:hypothetical protein